MRTEIIKNSNMNKILSLGTLEEISEYITYALIQNTIDFHFPDFDLAIADESALNEYKWKVNYLENVYNASSGWYGMKQINTGFDSESILSIVSDYYGGGCANILNIWEDELDDMSCTKEIMRTLIKTIEIQEGHFSENTIFVVEWDPNTFIEL